MTTICEDTKIPHRPERMVGRWCVSLGHELFKVEEAYTSMGLPTYIGTGLHGQEVRTTAPSALSPADNDKLEALLCAGTSPEVS